MGTRNIFAPLWGANARVALRPVKSFPVGKRLRGEPFCFLRLVLWRRWNDNYEAALRPSLGIGTLTPSSVYCFNLLRSVRMEMPKMFAA